MSSAHLSHLSVHNTLGATLIGFASSCCVFGVILSQMFSYFMRYPLDMSINKILVALIILLETADQAVIGHLVYHYTIVNFANVQAVFRAEVTWSFILQETLGATVGVIVKTYFALRVWRFSERNIIVTAIIVILAYGQFALALAFTVKAFKLPGVFYVVELRALGTTSLSVGVLTDIAIAAALCYYLNRLRTGYQQSDSLVDSLVRYAISTGLFTGAVSLTCLILYNVMPENLIFIAVYFNLSKLYAVSFLATLNARRQVQGRGTDRDATASVTHGQHTNIFHLGTRVPSMGPNEFDNYRGTKDTFPLTSFNAPVSGNPENGVYSPPKYLPTVAYGQAV